MDGLAHRCGVQDTAHSRSDRMPKTFAGSVVIGKAAVTMNSTDETKKGGRRKKAPLSDEERQKASKDLISIILEEFKFPVPSKYIAARLSATPRAVTATLYDNQDVFRVTKLKVEGKAHTVLWSLQREE